MTKAEKTHRKIGRLIKRYPKEPIAVLAKKHGLNPSYYYNVRARLKGSVRKKPTRRTKVYPARIQEALEQMQPNKTHVIALIGMPDDLLKMISGIFNN